MDTNTANSRAKDFKILLGALLVNGIFITALFLLYSQ